VFGLIICPNCCHFTQRYRERCAHCKAVLPGAEVLTPADRDRYALVLRKARFQPIVVGIPLIVLGLMLAFSGEGPAAVWILAIGVGLFFVWATTWPSVRNPDISPCVIIDANGIEDLRTTNVGMISWRGIAQVYARHSGRHRRILEIRLKSGRPRQYITRLEGALYDATGIMRRGDVRVSLAGLDKTATEIINHITWLKDMKRIPRSVRVGTDVWSHL